MRVNVVILGSGKNVERFIRENEYNDFIKIIGNICDDSFSGEIDSSLFSIMKQADICFSLGYSKIIPSEIFEKYFIVNLHAGILPKWRGFSANAWALMNGEKTIGYSIHRVSSELDGGLLYFVKYIDASINNTMNELNEIIIDSIMKECPEVLYKIATNIIEGVPQSKKEIAYCTRFDSSMGNMISFGCRAEYYVNLFRCMAQPLGSGVFFIYKDEKYDVGIIEHGGKYGVSDYICPTGKIVNIENNRLWVKVKDNVIVLSKITKCGEAINVKKYFRNGVTIGGIINA